MLGYCDWSYCWLDVRQTLRRDSYSLQVERCCCVSITNARISEYPIEKDLFHWLKLRLIPPPSTCSLHQPGSLQHLPSACGSGAQQGATGSMSSYLMETEWAGTLRAHGLPRWPVNSPHLPLLACPPELLSWRNKWILSPAGDRNHLETKEVKCPSGLVSEQSSWRKTAALFIFIFII